MGKKTVEEAIEIHYGESKENTFAPEKPTEVVPPTPPAEVPLQLNDTQTIVQESGEIILDFGDELDASLSSNETNSGLGGFAGWMRGRR